MDIPLYNNGCCHDYNTVTVTGFASGITVRDTATAKVVVGLSTTPPLINLIKKPSAFILSALGGPITYTYTVTNPGTEPLSNVTVVDDKCTGLPGRVAGHPGDLNNNDLLESNESWTFTCQTTVAGTTTNIGTTRGQANGLTAVDTASATVVTGSPGLPNTGSDTNSNNSAWGIIIPFGIVFALVSFYRAQKKRAIQSTH